MGAVAALLTGCGKPSGSTISMEEAVKRMNADPPAVVVDVRTPVEYANGHIPGAVLVPVEELRKGSDLGLLPDKWAELLLYCRTGLRAEEAAGLLTGKGYENVHDFGGIVDWTGEIETGL